METLTIDHIERIIESLGPPVDVIACHPSVIGHPALEGVRPLVQVSSMIPRPKRQWVPPEDDAFFAYEESDYGWLRAAGYGHYGAAELELWKIDRAFWNVLRNIDRPVWNYPRWLVDFPPMSYILRGCPA